MESPIAQSELPMLTGTDLSEQETLDLEAIPFATPKDKNNDQDIDSSSAATVAPQHSKGFIPPTSFYAKPPEKKENRKPLWVLCLFS